MLAPQARSGEEAVQRAQTEKELSAGDYAAGPAASDQVRQVGDKAFVLRGGMWIDTGFDPAVMKVEEIVFGSDRYFQLLGTRPEIGPTGAGRPGDGGDRWAGLRHRPGGRGGRAGAQPGRHP